MITFFTTAKAFGGHSGIIQRNALWSWKLLHPDVQVILFGNEAGAEQVSRDLGLHHEPEVARNSAGLPYMNYMFNRADEIASNTTLCYANCDIILTSDFIDALRQVLRTEKFFLMIGRRWDTDIKTPIDFSNSRWSDNVRQIALTKNDQRDEWWIDYFVFPRGMFYERIPNFVVGRPRWDNWTVWKALDCGALVVDASAAVLAIHQDHGYSAHPQGRKGILADESSRRNIELAGGRKHLRKIGDATVRLTHDGLKPNLMRYWHGAKREIHFVARAVTFGVWMPLWYLLLGLTRPLRSQLGLRSGANRQAGHKEPF